jgi:tetratricopeptide (TPR) repeat protein
MSFKDRMLHLFGNAKSPDEAPPVRATITRKAGDNSVETIVLDERLMIAEQFLVSGLVALTEGREAEALSEALSSVRHINAYPGPDSAQVVGCLKSLAELLGQLGSVSEAESLLQRALKSQRASFGSGDPRLVGTLSALGQLYASSGRLNEADAIYNQAVTLTQTAGLQVTADSVATLHRRAIVLQDLGRQEESIVEFRRALYACRGLEEDSPTQLTRILDGLARLLIQHKAFKEAIWWQKSPLPRWDGDWAPVIPTLRLD